MRVFKKVGELFVGLSVVSVAYADASVGEAGSIVDKAPVVQFETLSASGAANPFAALTNQQQGSVASVKMSEPVHN